MIKLSDVLKTMWMPTCFLGLLTYLVSSQLQMTRKIVNDSKLEILNNKATVLENKRLEVAVANVKAAGLSHLITVEQGDARQFYESRATAITASSVRVRTVARHKSL